VRVGFTHATKRQAEEIFLRMFIDHSTTASLRGLQEASAPSNASKSPEKASQEDDEKTQQLKELAKRFAAEIPDGDFSPADLQDYLLIHKKDPQAAVEQVGNWMQKSYDERKRKDDEKEEQLEARRREKREQRNRFREEVKAAVKGLNESDEGDSKSVASDKAETDGKDSEVEGKDKDQSKADGQEKTPAT
jgi:mitochondrial chaperone BCS1